MIKRKVLAIDQEFFNSKTINKLWRLYGNTGVLTYIQLMAYCSVNRVIETETMYHDLSSQTGIPVRDVASVMMFLYDNKLATSTGEWMDQAGEWHEDGILELSGTVDGRNLFVEVEE